GTDLTGRRQVGWGLHGPEQKTGGTTGGEQQQGTQQQGSVGADLHGRSLECVEEVGRISPPPRSRTRCRTGRGIRRTPTRSGPPRCPGSGRAGRSPVG